jgi:hypothetical protein
MQPKIQVGIMFAPSISFHLHGRFINPMIRRCGKEISKLIEMKTA